jgi:hypothetical protein
MLLLLPLLLMPQTPPALRKGQAAADAGPYDKQQQQEREGLK